MTLSYFKRLRQSFLLFLIFILISSCASRQDLVYFQDINQTISIPVKYELTYKPDDLLTIAVSALDMDAVRPFNIYVAEYRGGANGISATPSLQTYLIDAEGTIDFPVIGQIAIAGLTRKEATRLIIDKLKPFVNAPIVNIRLINFTINVLGEVNHPGRFTIPNERITLPEALGLANDLNIQGLRSNILVVREVDGKVTKTYIDLLSNAIFTSPFYYLQQNDMVYVEPNGAKIKSSRINPYTGITLSAISTLISIYAILIR